MGLDPQTRTLVWQDVLRLRREEQMTIFLTTHYMDEAECADPLAIIGHGSIVATGTPDEPRSPPVRADGDADGAGGRGWILRAGLLELTLHGFPRRIGGADRPRNGSAGGQAGVTPSAGG